MQALREVTVVGGGIIGASIAWHLTAAGAKVRLISEKANGLATPASFAWINAGWGNPEPYFRLRIRSMQEWRRLARTLPAIQPDWCGGLCWDLPPEGLANFASEHRNWGYGIEDVDRAGALAIEPQLTDPPDFALYVAEEGAVEPTSAAAALIADAKRKGMETISGLRVTGLKRRGDRITGLSTDQGMLHTEMVVLASGAGVPAIAATADIKIPIETPPGLIVHSKPLGKMLNGLILAPELHLRQTAEGRIIAGSDFAGTDPGENPEAAAAELFQKVQSFLRDGERLELDFHTVGYRPTPKDGFPIVGDAAVEGLYLAVTHSGITLAPALGLLAAQEILEGRQEPLLSPYRLSRFQ